MKKYIPILLLLAGCSYHTSEGDRTGIMTKVSRKGLICKTNEATMSLGFSKNGTGTVSKEDWHFTIRDKSVLDKVKQFQEANQPIKITYHDELFCICDSDPCTFADEVTPL